MASLPYQKLITRAGQRINGLQQLIAGCEKMATKDAKRGWLWAALQPRYGKKIDRLNRVILYLVKRRARYLSQTAEWQKGV